MISKKCTYENLLNHLKQKKYDYNLNYEHINDKNSLNHYHWIVSLEFNNKAYEVITQTKKEGIKKIMESASEDIYNFLNL
jgi:hypothetical protein